MSSLGVYLVELGYVLLVCLMLVVKVFFDFMEGLIGSDWIFCDFKIVDNKYLWSKGEVLVFSLFWK